MKYTIEIELPDNDTVRQTIKTDEFEWFWHGYHGRAKAKENRWIPCSERLPDKGLRVLMQLNNAWQIVGWYDKEDKQWFEVMYAEPVANDRVLAWMPLPPSYRGDSE